MTQRKLLYAAFAALLVAGFVLTQFRVRPDERPLGKPADILGLADRNDLNVIFVVVDTLRADRLGCYGYGRPTSPTLDHLAATGVRFANHLSQSSWTKTSMASLWTAMYPQRTGILRFDAAIPNAATMPAEILHDAGFLTAGLWRNGWVATTFGFEQGFEVYHRPNVGAPLDGKRRESKNPYAKLEGSDLDATDGAVEFLRTNKRDRFFLYIHYMDAHQYMSDEESAIFGTTYTDLYDNSIHWTDRQIAMLLAALDEQKLRDKTMLVVVSDHGEAFLEHGNEGHAKDLHREVVRTPVIISFPFSLERGIVVDAMTENVDVWPTILSLLGEAPIAEADGRSRRPEILAIAGVEGGGESPSDPRPSYAQLDRTWGKADAAAEPLIAVTLPDRRFMRGFGTRTGAQLYDTQADPREQKDLLHEGPPVDVKPYDDLIDAYRALPDPSWRKEVGTVELDDMQKGQLRAIGYAVE
jgi:arylsulfatase A-like enzyme